MQITGLILALSLCVLTGNYNTPALAQSGEETPIQYLEANGAQQAILAGSGGCRIAPATETAEVLSFGIPLWVLEWRLPDNQNVRMDSTQGTCRVMGGGNQWHLLWTGLKLGADNNTQVRVILSNESAGETQWQMQIQSRNREATLRQWYFPRLLVPLEGARVVQPNGWGIVYENPEQTGLIQAAYPSLQSSMQFLAATRAGRYLYLAAHDEICHLKLFTAQVEKETRVLRMEVSALTSQPGRSLNMYIVPFPIITKVAPGDWYDAAQTYRHWAQRAPWCSKGSMAKRQETPQWLKQNALWMMLNGVEGAPDQAAKWTAEMKVPSTAHWYRWHVIPFDTHYPDYFPALDGFTEAVKKVQEQKIRTMPYINARLWCPEAPSWIPENASACAVLQENGSLWIEKYGNSPPLAVMCPATKQWQDKINGLVEKILSDFGVDGLYLDQITAAAGVPCWNPAHEHPLGGGYYWAQGYRQMLIRAKKTIGPERILTSEENTECWMDILDAHLMVNTPRMAGTVIPLYPAVYNDYTLTFGFQYLMGDDFTAGLPFRAKMARAFVWGSQPGWVDAGIITGGKYPKETEYLKALGGARATNPNALMGRMLRPPKVDDVPVITINAKDGDSTYTLNLPAVLAGLFEDQNNQTWLALTNWTDEEAHPKISASTGLIADATSGWKAEGNALKGTLPPRSARVLAVKEN